MGLRDISYKEDYRSGYNDIVAELLRPSLEVSNEYWRAVGYFSSSSLEAFGAPLVTFIKNGGKIRLVTSVELSARDLKAIEEGASRKEVCESRLEAIIAEQFAEGMTDGVARLCSLIELGRMEIQIAVPKNGTGIYHEKIGVFLDGEDYVAFTGSSNESLNSFENNRECVDVYPSWSSKSRAERKKLHFEDVWNRNDQGVEVYSFPDALDQRLLRISEQRQGWKQNQTCKLTADKWRHQAEAVDKFLKAERGVLNMATGTGKTWTALEVLRALFKVDKIDTVIVSMEGTDLFNQWYGEMLSLRQQLPFRVTIFRDYERYKETHDFLLEPIGSVLLVSRHPGQTRDPLVSALRRLTPVQARRTLLIHDEVHNLGSPENRRRLTDLSDRIRFRLGLSATPQREYDKEGTEFIDNHIGGELMQFGLHEAIRRGILSPFNYFTLYYELSIEDRERVKDVYKRQAARAHAGEPMSDEEVWIEIARVYKTSHAKLPVFAEFIADNSELLKRCIIFVETQEYGREVLDLVHSHRADFHTYFTGEQSETLRRFAAGDLECLITCHRLSEGIDIKSLNSVILFSSARARLETIQRIGRCLRTDPNNPAKVANVVDFIRYPSNDEADILNADEERRAWLSSLSNVRAGANES